MIPRTETAPVALALYLLSNVSFALLIPVDLLSQSYEPNIYKDAPFEKIRKLFLKAGKVTLLSSQMTWVIGNIENCSPVETFKLQLLTPSPSPGSSTDADEFSDPTPQTIEGWIDAQTADPNFRRSLDQTDHVAVREGLHIYCPPGEVPKILVPPSNYEPLIRSVHIRMFHLGSSKVTAELRKTYFWPTLRADVKRILDNCPDCELEKARQSTSHGLFAARPFDAPRSRWAMDFQGQGLADSGETQALGIIDTTARYVIVIPLVDREAETFLQPFLDSLVFVHGPPDVLHSDAAAEFLSDAMKLLSEATDTHTTTTLGHNAQANGTIEVFWRFWNRCMRLLSDDHYRKWPQFTSRICYAYNTAIHESLGGISPYEIFFGVTARNPFATAVYLRNIDDELPAADLNNPAAFAEAVKISAAAFTRLARDHTEYVRVTTADRLNRTGTPRTYSIADKVKIRIPPTHEMMLATGRRSSHLASWRGPCTITARLSTTAHSMKEDATGRKFERVVTNILPCRAVSARGPAAYDPKYSDPFSINEFIAVRDSPGEPFYIATVKTIRTKSIKVQCLGCTQTDLERAVFRPCWHLPNSNYIKLAIAPPNNHIACTGTLELDSLRNLLVGRNMLFTKAMRLRKKSQRIIDPMHDELFIFER